MPKNFVLDTNVLLQDSDCLFQFDDNVVVIPIGVIEELDKFKKDNGELGRNARRVSRILDAAIGRGDLRHGVPINKKKGIVKVLYNGNLGSYDKEKNVDLHVIHIAEKLTKQEPENECIIISRDINVRIRANALGLKAGNYEATRIAKNIDSGWCEVICPSDLIIDFLGSSKLPIDEIVKYLPRKPVANYYLYLIDESKSKKALARISSDKQYLQSLIESPMAARIKTKNMEQAFLIDALMDESINLVCVSGKAGSGKTICSTAIGLYLSEVTNVYSRLLISRPVFPMGKDLGFLPGSIEEKLEPWMQPIYDAVEIISKKKGKSGKDIVQESSSIFVEPLTYIRGRSIHDQFMIIDESQNLCPLEVKTIITRAGEHTKIVLTGDVSQIDNPYVDALSNGLSVTIKKFIDCPISAYVSLEKGVRSPLSEEATNRL